VYGDDEKRPALTDDRGVYLSTRDGHLVYLLDPRPEDFDPVRTARTLSNEHRYVGNFGPYSVAQHAVLVSEVAEDLAYRALQEDASDPWSDEIAEAVRLVGLAALHHDDSEYVTGDLPQPVKSLFPEFKRFEKSFEPAIEARYGIDLSNPLIKEADRIVFCAEIRVLIPAHGQAAYGPYGDPEYRRDRQPSWGDVVPWSADKAFARYMDTHERLTRRAP
jgi:hypothetical protein